MISISAIYFDLYNFFNRIQKSADHQLIGHFRKKILFFRDTREHPEHDAKNRLSISSPSSEKPLAEIHELKKNRPEEKQQLQTQLPTKSMKTEKVCQKETSKQPTPKLQTQPHNSESNSTTQTNSKKSKKNSAILPKIIPPAHNSLSAEEDVKTPTGSSSLDQDFLKTSQNLDLEEFRKSLEQINNS